MATSTRTRKKKADPQRTGTLHMPNCTPSTWEAITRVKETFFIGRNTAAANKMMGEYWSLVEKVERLERELRHERWKKEELKEAVSDYVTADKQLKKLMKG